MSNSLVTALSVIPVFVWTWAGAPEEAPSAQENQPAPMTRFPHFTGRFVRQLDGSAVCSYTTNVYVSAENLRRWSHVPIAAEKSLYLAHLQPAGGDRKRLFFVMTQQGERRLLAVDVGGKASVLRKVPPQPVAFASAEVGAAAVQFSVLLTRDAGKTWAHAARLAESEDVSALLWLSESRLLVGGKHGAVQLSERQGDKLRRLWAITLPQTAVNAFAPDGGYVWARAGGFFRLALADGREDARIKPGVTVEGFAVCHGRLLTWYELAGKRPDGDFDIKPGIVVWARKGGAQSYEREAKIQMPLRNGFSPIFVAAIFPEQTPRCVVFSKDGDAFVLDLEENTTVPTTLQVTPLPKELAARPDAETMKLFQKMVALGKQLSFAESEAIIGEANKRMDLTPVQRVELAIEKLEQAIERHKKENRKE